MIDMTITTIVIVTIIITVVIIIVVVKLLNMFENMLKATSTLFFYVFLNVFSWSPYLIPTDITNIRSLAGLSGLRKPASPLACDHRTVFSCGQSKSEIPGKLLAHWVRVIYPCISYNFMTSSTVHKVWGDGWLSFKITPKLLLMSCVSLWCFGCNGP